MRAAMSQLQLSARAFHRILKLVRTIADLADCENSKSAVSCILPKGRHPTILIEAGAVISVFNPNPHMNA
jgi:hypothetical protein